MKKLILAALALTSSTVFAGQVTVLEAKVRIVETSNQNATARFYMDQKTGQGYVKASVTERLYGRHPNRDNESTTITVYSETVKVDGLVLMGDQAVYQGAEGNVVCGTMGVSRVFKVPTLYLSGDCALTSTLMRDGRRASKLIVTLITK